VEVAGSGIENQYLKIEFVGVVLSKRPAEERYPMDLNICKVSG
jgi:hypothetical protein